MICVFAVPRKCLLNNINTTYQYMMDECAGMADAGRMDWSASHQDAGQHQKKYRYDYLPFGLAANSIQGIE